MKTFNKFWLLLSLVAPQLTSPAAAMMLGENCAVAVAESKVPKAKLGIAIAVDKQEPLAPSFKKYLYEESSQTRMAAQIENAAVLFAATNHENQRVFQSNDDTYVKYDRGTRELIVVAFEKILFYDRLAEDDGDWFNGLRKAKVRANVRLEKVQRFDFYGLRTHFEKHGNEFNTTNPAEYERMAIEFAETSSQESLIMEVEDRGTGRWVKIDFATREIVVVAKDTNELISYYVRERHPFHYFLGRVKIIQSPNSR